MTPFALFIVVIASAIVVFAQEDPYNDRVGHIVFSHVLFRHGERMPLEFYPNDPHKDRSQWKFDVAQLTDVGVNQQYKLGEWLRRRYVHLVSDRYEPSEVYVQSTDADRTLMSAQSCLAGFYGGYRPVPVHTVPVLSDTLLGAASTCPCPVYDAEVERVKNLPEVQSLQAKFKTVYDYVSNHTGNEVQDFAAAIKIYDTLAIEEHFNKSLPEWTRTIYPEPIQEAGLYSFVLPTWTTLLQRLKVGQILKDMVEHFQAKRARTLSPDRKLWVYSAHDATITALLNSLKAYDIHFPPYSACMLVELRLKQEQYFVTLSYRNSTVEEPLLLPILSCGAACPLDQFVSLVQPLMPGDWEQECIIPPQDFTIYIWLGVILTVFISCCVSIFIFLMKRKSRRTYYTMSTPTINIISKKNMPVVCN